LFSITKRTGSFQTAARFSASWKSPSLVAPSPQNAAATVVFPTPTIGMVGLIDDLRWVTRAGFTSDGDAIVLLGDFTDELGASEYLARVHALTCGAPPRCDLAAEKRLIDTLLACIQAGHVASAHDCSDGGFAVALAECAMMERDAAVGVDVDLTPWANLPERALLFGEAQGRIIVSTTSPSEVVAAATRAGVPAHVIGRVGARDGVCRLRLATGVVETPVSTLAEAYHEAIPRIMTRVATATIDAHEGTQES
jgi:phosphoribosylformylglycinamidine synthase